MSWAWRQLGSHLWELESDDGILKQWNQSVGDATSGVQVYQFELGTSEADCMRQALQKLNGILVPAGGVLLAPKTPNTANTGQYPFTFIISSYDRGDQNTTGSYAKCSIILPQKDSAIFNAASPNKRWRFYFNRIPDRYKTTNPPELNNLSPSNPKDWNN